MASSSSFLLESFPDAESAGSDKKTRMDRIMGEELEMEERKGCDGCDWKWPL